MTWPLKKLTKTAFDFITTTLPVTKNKPSITLSAQHKYLDFARRILTSKAYLS
jgi:hypothetical protein